MSDNNTWKFLMPVAERERIEKLEQDLANARAAIAKVSGQLGHERLVSADLRRDIATREEVRTVDIRRLREMRERAEAAELERDLAINRVEVAEKLLERGLWQNAGQCPLCAAPETYASHDLKRGVKVSYCLNCETVTLWQNETPQPTGTTTGWDAATFYSGSGEPD